MPVSTPVHISHCLERIIPLAPRSVLDIGCGFGLWGFLCREYLDVWNGRVQPAQWEVRIDGIEMFEPYIQPHQRALYTGILIEDVRQAVRHIEEYDLIIAGDVIEHLDKRDGEAVLDCLYEKARMALMINIPLGAGWNHPEMHGNPGELHRSQWNEEDLVRYPSEVTKFGLPCGEYGVFWCMKPPPPGSRVQGLLLASEFCQARGDIDSAMRVLRQAQALAPDDEAVVLPLVNVLLQHGERAEAVQLLRRAAGLNPHSSFVSFLLARVLALAGRHAEAKEELLRLFSLDDVPEETIAAARQLQDEILRLFR